MSAFDVYCRIMYNAITDIPGIKVGHAHNQAAGTGCTVVLCESGAIAAADVRGGAPGTREINVLDTANIVDHVHAVYLGGGSAYGLAGATGVMDYLESKGVGFNVGVAVVPIVPGAVLFDLAVGDPTVRPDASMGRAACEAATAGVVAQGNVGAGCGASVGKITGHRAATKSGIGTASVQVGELIVGAIIAVNAVGDVIDPRTGAIIAGPRGEGGFLDTRELLRAAHGTTISPFEADMRMSNTTIGVVATNAALTPGQAQRLAIMAQDGYARTIRPVHTTLDGDTVFSLSLGAVQADLNLIGSLAADVVAEAVLAAVRHARAAYGLPAAADVDRTSGNNKS